MHRSSLIRHARRLGVEFATRVLDHQPVWAALGSLNRRWGFIQSIFLVYPATPDYALEYAYPYRLRRHRWEPIPAGLLWQDRRLVLMFAISATDSDFTAPDADENLRALERRFEELRTLLRTERKTFAGVLPGILARRRILSDPPERDLTARVVMQAVAQTQGRQRANVPLVVLGGTGFIGSRVVELSDGLYKTYAVDPAGGRDPWPEHLHGTPTIVLNVAHRHALDSLVDQLWPGVIVLNEVYPEPRGELLQRLSDAGAEVWHVVGVKAGAVPPFPSGYRGAVPCCAAWPSPGITAVVRRLSCE